MSLIDEALKRAQAAQEAERGRDGRPWTPPPLPDARRTPRSRVRWSFLLASVAAILVAALLLQRSGSSAKTPLGTPGAKTPAPAAGLPPISSEVAVSPPPRALAFPAAPRSRGETSAPSGATPAPGLPANSLPTPAAGAGAASAPRGEMRDARPRSAGAEPRSYAGEMPLPGGAKITLDGIVFSEESPVAVVNGHVLPVGGSIEGYAIVRILPDRIELEREGSSVVLTLR